MLETAIVASTFVINLLIAIIVYRNNPRSATHVFLSALSLCMALWVVSNYAALLPSDETTRLFWVRVVMFVTTPFGPLIFLLATIFPKNSLDINKKLLAGIMLCCLITAGLALSPYMFTKLENLPENSFSLSPGFGIGFYAVTFLGFMTWGFIRLIKKYRSSHGILKKQLSFFLIGIIISFVLMTATNFIAVVVFKTISLTFLGPTFTLIMISFMAYAVVKHRFLDIKLVVVRTVSFTVLTGLLGFLYALLFGVLSSIYNNSTLEIKTLAVSTTLALIMAFSFQPLRRILEKVSDKIFYKDKYDANKLLYELALIMSSTIRLEDLAVRVLTRLLEQMRISSGGFILMDKGNLYRIFSEGFDGELKIDKNQIQLLYKYQTFIFDDMPEDQTKEVMRQLNFKMVIPLKTQNEEIGIFILGDKLSGDIYTSEDIRVLETLAPEIAIAVQNAKAFEEIKKFNITLQEEVDKATKSLQVANQKLKELDLLKNDFVSIASHELRTPMTAIRSYVWMALHKSDIPLSQKLERYLFRTLVSTERLINLVNDMLNVSRIESGKIEISPKPFDIVSLVKDVVEEVRVKAEEKKITISVLEHSLSPIFADVDKVHQVLLNLVGNSLKFCYPSGLISIDFFVDEKFIEVIIADNGAGISKDDLSKLFHKFSRLDSSYTSVGTSGGTGLGLYISKSLIELMHGQIKASSEGVEKGTTVTFSLPIATQELIDSSEKFHIKPEDGDIKTLEPVVI